MIEVSIDDRTIDQVREWIKKRPEQTIKELNTAVKQTVYSVEAETKRNSPVDTGRLRASVNREERYLEGEVYAGVYYAIHVHEGTRFMRGRPFMLNAVRSLKTAINKYFSEAMGRVIK
jgi:HK97 gp10 family phage protein